MTNEVPEYLKATHEGEIKIGDWSIPCAVLEDGSRVLTQRGFLAAIGRSGSIAGGSTNGLIGGEHIPPFLAAKGLQPFVNQHVTVATTPVGFVPLHGGRPAFGYRAELLPQTCRVYLAARRAGGLVAQQLHIADQCEVILHGLGELGIIGLVDEATGYQYSRERTALQEIFEKFIQDNQRRWESTFPKDYYKEIYRLNDWKYEEGNTSHPSVVGLWTNDIVYERLAPRILERLQALNPIDESGQRKYKHHQFLTEDVGLKNLEALLASVVTLMKTSQTWVEFQFKLNQAFPKFHSTMMLPLPDPNASEEE